MADKYVKLDDVLRVCTEHEDWYRETNDQFGTIVADDIFQSIINLPAADVVEVKHGEWKHECLECSVCKRNISEICDADSYLTSGIEDELLFCPFCGAKMDGGKGE